MNILPPTLLRECDMELIYNQGEIPRDRLRYGLRSSAATGCGWVAVYNALLLLGKPMAPETLIRKLEHQLPLVHGNAGTIRFGPALLLRSMGFSVRTLSDRRKFDEAARSGRVCILFYYWRHKWKFGSHFVCLRYIDGRFEGFNTFRNSKGPDNYGESLDTFLKKHRFFGCYLAVIGERKL